MFAVEYRRCLGLGLGLGVNWVGVVVWNGEKREAGRDGLNAAALEPKQLLILMERGEGVDRRFDGNKLNDDITNQVGTDRGRRAIQTGRQPCFATLGREALLSCNKAWMAGLRT
jgi:hypothetical protein